MKVIKYSIALFFILVCATSPIRAQVLPKLSTYDYMMGNGANTWYTKINAAIDSLNSLIDSLAVHRAMIYVAAGGTVDSLQFLGTNRDNQSVYGATRFLDSVYVALVLRFGYWPGQNNGYIKSAGTSGIYYDHGWGGSHLFTGFFGTSVLTMNTTAATFYVPLKVDSLTIQRLSTDSTAINVRDSGRVGITQMINRGTVNITNTGGAQLVVRSGEIQFDGVLPYTAVGSDFFVIADSANSVKMTSIDITVEAQRDNNGEGGCVALVERWIGWNQGSLFNNAGTIFKDAGALGSTYFDFRFDQGSTANVRVRTIVGSITSYSTWKIVVKYRMPAASVSSAPIKIVGF